MNEGKSYEGENGGNSLKSVSFESTGNLLGGIDEYFSEMIDL